MSFTHKIRAGVLRGGPSAEYEVSLKTGSTILSNLPEEYEPVDIFISKQGAWHEKGLEKSPENILKRIDVVVNGLHGKYGEDGEVQRLLESFNVPYTGSGSLSSAMAMNKMTAKRIYKNHSLKTPFATTLHFEKLSRNAIREIYHTSPMPAVIKPSDGGSSIGVYTAHTLPDLEEAIVASAQHSPLVMIEEFIQGKEATCGVIDDFREKEHYALLPIEIRHKSNFFDYNSKYSATGGAEEICPGNFTSEESKMIEKMAIEAHKALGMRHYSRSDFMIHPKRGIFILETNSLPGLTETSLIPKSLSAIGSNIKEFLAHILNKALGKR
jgi:D-alanine-D-alanine ligase